MQPNDVIQFLASMATLFFLALCFNKMRPKIERERRWKSCIDRPLGRIGSRRQ